MLKLRLKKYGRKGKPSYRIVATDSRVKRDGKAIEELGFYNPAYSQSSVTSSSDNSNSDNSSSNTKEKSKKNNQNVVEDLKELNDLYKSGVISLEEFEKAKKKLLN